MFRNFRLGQAVICSALAVAAGAVAFPRVACAEAFSYNSQQKTINAGIIVLRDVNNPSNDLPNTDPYPFYILNQRPDIKPAGWQIVNPLAPKTVTPQLQNTWNSIAQQILTPPNPYGIGPGKNIYSLGAQVTQNMAPYWEVNLSSIKNVDDLRQFNILLLNMRSNIGFTVPEREMLRQYVDGGGQLLIENTTVDSSNTIFNIDPVKSLFINFGFASGSYTSGVLPLSGGGTSFRHPILSEPNFLGRTDINGLGHSDNYSTAGHHFVTSVLTAGSDPFGFVSDVLLNQGGLPVVQAGQYGAGEIVVDTTASCNAINDFLGGFDATPAQNSPNSGPFCNGNAGSNVATGPDAFARAPIADLKFLVNVMSWSGLHNSEFGGSHQNSVSTTAVSAAVTPTWHYQSPTSVGTYTAPTPPLFVAGAPGSAIYGHYLATVDVSGVLHVFDLFPSEDIDGDGLADDGISDYSQGAGYDEIWNSSATTNPGVFSSAPTIATVTGATTPSVFVESAQGIVYKYDLASGGTPSTYTPPSSSTSKYGVQAPVYAPAPTYYGGRLYAGQIDGSVMVVNFLNGAALSQFSPQPNPLLASGYLTGPEYVTAPPSVSYEWQNGVGGQPYNNDLVLFVPTNRCVYSVLLGSAAELLTASGSTYTTKITNSTNAAFDLSPSSPDPTTFTLDASLYPVLGSATKGTSSFTDTTDTPPLYGNYFTALNGAAGTAVTRMTVASSELYNYNTGTLTGFSAYTSAAAIDKNGYAYVSVTDPGNGSRSLNSCIECLQDGPIIGTRYIRWRFRLPTTLDGSFTDASGISYSTLNNFHFVGAPVIDANGQVYALAVSSTGDQAAVLSFDTNKAIQANVFGANTPTSTVSNYNVTQPVGSGSEFGQTSNDVSVPLIQGVQFTGGANGLLDFTNFAVASSPSQGFIVPNLSEPEPIQVSYTSYDGTNNVPVGPISVALTSNMNWCIHNAVAAPVTAGLSLVGDYLFFGDTAGNLYRVSVQVKPSDVAAAQKIIDISSNTNLLDQLDKKVWAVAATGLTGANSIPASGSGSLIVNGYVVNSGNTYPAISVLQNKTTLIADSDRIMEVDADGDATWSVDSTSRSDLASNAIDAGGKITISHMDFNHPAMVSQIDSNNYLVADTGNNRCVEFDRSGKVIWELTRFRDPQGLLANAGQADTLNQPTSVREIRTSSGSFTKVKYLIADSGNSRIIEISDVFNADGTLAANGHTLTWVSHTYDVLGRDYRYVSADYVDGPDGQKYITGLVSNKRIGQFSTAVATGSTYPKGTQGPEGGDAPGGSIVMLDYYPTGSTYAANPNAMNGFIHVDKLSSGNYALRTYSDFAAYLQTTTGNNNKFDLNAAVTDFAASTPGQNANSNISLVNPRFLSAYVSKIGGTATINFLVTDDNGAFDVRLSPTTNKLAAQWGFTKVDYQSMTTLPTGMITAPPFNRSLVPFAPTSLQIIGSSQYSTGSGSYPVSQYLLAAAGTQGDVGALDVTKTPFRVGGEVFSWAYNTFTGLPDVGGFASDDRTISRPSNTGPLVQPMSASRTQ